MAQRAPEQPLPLSSAVAAGALLVRQGDASARAWIVVSGGFLATCVDDNGRVFAPDVFGPGDVVGGIDGGGSPWTLRALRRTVIAPATAPDVNRFAERHRVRVATIACDLAWLDVATRLERRIEDLAGRFGRPAPGGVSIDLGLRQEDLAALVGSSRESVNRALATSRRVRRVARGRYLLRPDLESGRAGR
jgi:CRP/FNR family transcriptional regulator, cyclic AMP receptor protein